MAITEQETEKARTVLLECLNTYHGNAVLFHEVWAKPRIDMDEATYLKVWVIYKGEPADLDIGRLTSFNTHALQALKKAGIDAMPSITYIPEKDKEQLGTPWIGES